MADTLLLQLVSPERILVEEHATEMQIPGRDGYMGILPGHAPLISELAAGGVFTYRADGQEKVLAVYGGFVEVLPDRVRVLADGAERVEEIDIEKARQRLEAARKASEFANEPGDPAVVLDEIMRAQAAVEAASKK